VDEVLARENPISANTRKYPDPEKEFILNVDEVTGKDHKKKPMRSRAMVMSLRYEEDNLIVPTLAE